MTPAQEQSPPAEMSHTRACDRPSTRVEGSLRSSAENTVFGFFTAFGFIAVAVMPAAAGGGLSQVPSQAPFCFAPRRPAVRRAEPEYGDAPSALAAAAAAGSCALLPVALCLPIFTMTNEEALSAFVPGGRAGSRGSALTE